MKNTKILLADDDNMIRESSTLIFNSLGYNNIKTVDNGEKALNELVEGNYGLLITDTNMPKLNGYEVITWYKCNPSCNGTKFIAMGGGIDTDIQDIYKELGVPFLEKPYNISKLITLVEQVLRKS